MRFMGWGESSINHYKWKYLFKKKHTIRYINIYIRFTISPALQLSYIYSSLFIDCPIFILFFWIMLVVKIKWPDFFPIYFISTKYNGLFSYLYGRLRSIYISLFFYLLKITINWGQGRIQGRGRGRCAPPRIWKKGLKRGKRYEIWVGKIDK